MTLVRISYDPDLSKIGTTREVDPAEARRLVRRGRAVVVPAGTVRLAGSDAKVTAPRKPRKATKPRTRKPKPKS